MKLGSFLVISLLLLLLWTEGLFVFHADSMLVHLLLLVAVFFFVGYLVQDTTLDF